MSKILIVPAILGENLTKVLEYHVYHYSDEAKLTKDEMKEIASSKSLPEYAMKFNMKFTGILKIII